MRRRLDGWIFKEMVWGNDEGENSWVNLERPRGGEEGEPLDGMWEGGPGQRSRNWKVWDPPRWD